MTLTRGSSVSPVDISVCFLFSGPFSRTVKSSSLNYRHCQQELQQPPKGLASYFSVPQIFRGCAATCCSGVETPSFTQMTCLWVVASLDWSSTNAHTTRSHQAAHYPKEEAVCIYLVLPKTVGTEWGRQDCVSSFHCKIIKHKKPQQKFCDIVALTFWIMINGQYFLN